MTIMDFDEIGEETIPHFKDGKKEMCAMFSDDLKPLMRITLVPGNSIGLHQHDSDREVAYALHGTGKVIIA